MFQLPLLDREPSEVVNIKCPVEKDLQPHETKKIIPVYDVDPDPMMLLKLSKRIVICQSCGSMRLVN